MTLVIIDGYDYLPNSPQTVLIAQGWNGSTGSLAADNGVAPAFGYGKALKSDGNANSSDYYRNARGRHTTGMVWGQRIYIPTSTTGANYRWSCVDSATTGAYQQWEVAFDSFGCIYFYTFNNNASTLVAKTSAYTFFPGRWFYCEVKWTPGYVTGSFELRVNTVPVLSLPSVRTANGTLILPATQPGFDLLQHSISRTSGGSNNWSMDDMYLLTQTGPQNNDYLGNVRAKYMAPVANSTPLDWTIGGSAPAATNWQSVLNLALNDTKFVYASTVGFQDLYQIDPNLNTPQVFGVEVGGSYRQDDATQRWAKNTIESGGVGATGVAHALNQSYTFYHDIYELNPNTGVAFTGAEVNALLVGPEVDV